MGCRSTFINKSDREREKGGRRGEENVLECFLVELEEDLERRRDARGLHFPPKPTFIAPDTIHNARHVPKMRLELFFQNLYPIHPPPINHTRKTEQDTKRQDTHIGILPSK